MGLAKIEEQMERAERQAEIARLRSVQQLYDQRRAYTASIDGFWQIVLTQHPEFSEYVSSEDLKYVEQISNIHIQWDIAAPDADEAADPGDFAITFEFSARGSDFPAQTVTKEFKLEQVDPHTAGPVGDDDSETEPETQKLVSESVEIVWPRSYDSINPGKIQDKKTPEGKKRYRAGMKSLFAFFRWTGLKPGKEFPNGEELARLFSEDIFPYAVKYYTEAQRDGLEEELDSDASEALDLSGDESPDEPSESEPHKKRKLQ